MEKHVPAGHDVSFLGPTLLTEQAIMSYNDSHLAGNISQIPQQITGFQEATSRISGHLFSFSTLLSLLIAYGILYTSILVVYRLCFSPIASFPGPFLAKVTHWYEFYHNWIRTGMYYEVIEEMHKKYGKILQQSPCVSARILIVCI